MGVCGWKHLRLVLLPSGSARSERCICKPPCVVTYLIIKFMSGLNVMMLGGNALLNPMFLSRGVYKVFHYSRNAFSISKEWNKLHCDKAFLESCISNHSKTFGNDMVSVPDCQDM